MAILSVTGAPAVLGALNVDISVPLAIVRGTATDNGDGTWSVTVHTPEEQVPVLQATGATVTVVVNDAEELARWQVIDTQIDYGPGPGVA